MNCLGKKKKLITVAKSEGRNLETLAIDQKVFHILVLTVKKCSMSLM